MIRRQPSHRSAAAMRRTGQPSDRASVIGVRKSGRGKACRSHHSAVAAVREARRRAARAAERTFLNRSFPPLSLFAVAVRVAVIVLTPA